MAYLGSGLQDVINKLDEVGSTVQSAVNTFFKKDLHDLVSGIRANKGNEAKYINDCIQEIKEELKSVDHDDQAVAVLKLTYLQMLGYNMDWASFRAIEVISHSDYAHKRIGYLAACQSFSESTDVMVLITNLIRKDCLSPNLYDGGIALNCLANICTTELARDLVPDIVSMLSSARPYIRKKAVLVMYKIFLRYPDALRPSFPRLKEKLDDADTVVVSAAVNVICELAKKNAKNYLPLAPTLFKLLTKSSNNWMLIKVIKLFALLIPLEERLGKRLAEPLCNIINSTNSMSLMYEAIYSCIVGLSSYRNVMQLCSSKLRMFIEHPDQNLKYLGLVALSKIMEVFPKGIMEHRDIILNCLEDEDQTIRLRAVELLTGMVDKKNLAFIVDKLRHYLDTAEGAYRDELLEKIIYICSQDKYNFISDFEWYLGVLIDLTHVKGIKNGPIVSAQILDVAIRVKVVRGSASRMMLELLKDKVLLTEDVKAGSMCEALYAAAWVVGEYADLCEDHVTAIDTLTQPEAAGLPAHIQSIYVHNALKVFASLALVGKTPENPVAENPDLVKAITLLKSRLPLFTASPYIEVQERASFFEQLLKIFEEQSALGVNIADELAIVASDILNPVASNAQARVPKPPNLDLDAWINDPIPEEEEEPFGFQKPALWGEEHNNPPHIHSDPSWNKGFPGYGMGNTTTFTEPGSEQSYYRKEDPAETERQRQIREKAIAENEYYIRGDSAYENVVDAPVASLDAAFPQEAESLRHQMSQDNPRSRYNLPKNQRNLQPVSIIRDEEMPEGYIPGDEPEQKPVSVNTDALAKGVDLFSSEPVAPIQQRTHRSAAADKASITKPRSQPIQEPGARIGGRGTGRLPPGARAPGRYPPGARVPGRIPRAGRAPPGNRPPGSALGRGPRGGVRGRAPGVRRGGSEQNTSGPQVAAGIPESVESQPANVQKPVVRKGPNPRLVPLCNDSNLEVSVELLSNKSHKNELLAVFHIKNISEQPIEKIQFLFESSPNFQVTPHPSMQPTDPIPVPSLPAPQVTVPFKLPFRYETFLELQKLSGFIEYPSGKIDITLAFPCSASIIPEEVTPVNFVQVVRNDAKETRICESIKTSLNKAAARIGGLFRLKPVEKDEQKVSLYGKTPADNHVAFLIKKNEGTEESVSVAIKSDNATLATSLLQELENLQW